LSRWPPDATPNGQICASYLEYRQRTWPTTINPTCSSTPNG